MFSRRRPGGSGTRDRVTSHRVATQRIVFRDRCSAGELLGVEVARFELSDPVVLGLPRGGVPVAAKVAEALCAPLDVSIVRKLGVPSQPELAMGAIGENGITVVNEDIMRSTRVTEEEFLRVESRERRELDRRLLRVRAIAPVQPIAGRSVVIVDDGIATGATVRAAISVARANRARDVTVATPVAPPGVPEMLRSAADNVICLSQPRPFSSVGRWYRDFAAVGEDEVLALLATANRRDR